MSKLGLLSRIRVIWLVRKTQGRMTKSSYHIHLCFYITVKLQMLVPDWYKRILDYTRKYDKKKCLKWKLHDTLIQYCLVVDFWYFLANLSHWHFLNWPKTFSSFFQCFITLPPSHFESCYEWLTMADITQKIDLKKILATQYKWAICVAI